MAWYTHPEHANVSALFHVAHRHSGLLQGPLEAEAAAQVEAHHVLQLSGVRQQIHHFVGQHAVLKHTILGTVRSVRWT